MNVIDILIYGRYPVATVTRALNCNIKKSFASPASGWMGTASSEFSAWLV